MMPPKGRGRRRAEALVAAAAAIGAIMPRPGLAEMCRSSPSNPDALPEGVPAGPQCLLCPNTVGDAPRPRTVYLVNGACSWDTPTTGAVVVGTYNMAPGQILVGLPQTVSPPSDAVVTLDGNVRVTGPNSGVLYLALTRTLTAQAPSVAHLMVQNITVPGTTTGLLVLSDRGRDTIDATGMTVANIHSAGKPDGPAQIAAVGMVHVEGAGIEVRCADPTDVLAIQTFMPTDALGPVDRCTILNLTALFDVLGSAVTNAMYDKPPPSWLVTIQRFNGKGTGWLILLTALFVIARPPKPKVD